MHFHFVKISHYTKTCISFCMYLQHNVLNVNWSEDFFKQNCREI